jgi:hypothetical protein
MNKFTVALCYSLDTDDLLIDSMRKCVDSFGYRAEYLINTLAQQDPIMNRTTLTFGRGYDLVIIICDGTKKNAEYEALGLFNHTLDDPWATCVVAVGSPEWKGPQPTIAIESARYLGYFHSNELSPNLLESLHQHRKSLVDRGLSEGEWKSIRSYS